jgi:endonuclease-8
MPEGPEVRNIARELNEKLCGVKIARFDGQWSQQIELKESSEIREVFSFGKAIFIQFTNNKALEIHLGLVAEVHVTPTKKENARFSAFNEQDEHVFCIFDKLNFGSTKLVDLPLSKNAVDVCDSSEAKIKDRLTQFSSKRSTLGALLLDQKILCGIGNYLRSEICFHACLDPRTKFNSLTPQQFATLSKSIYIVCTQYYEGKRKHCVYQKKTDPKGNQVMVIKISGRKVFIVPSVQATTNQSKKRKLVNQQKKLKKIKL